MDDEYLFLLLLLVKNNGNIYKLATIKYDFVQLSRHLKKLKEDNIIEYFDNHLKLTKDGLSQLEYLAKKLNYTGCEKWISPQVYYHKHKINKDMIYLP